MASLLSEWMIQRSSHFRAERVTVTGTHWVSPDSVRRLADVPLGLPLYSLSTRDIKQRVERHSWVQNAVIYRHAPSEVEICITEREPVAALRGRELLIVTADGTALRPISETWVWNLPLLSPPYTLTLSAGSQISDSLTLLMLNQILILRRQSQPAWRNLNEFYFRGNQLLASFSQPPVEIMLGGGGTEYTWSYLLQFLNRGPRDQMVEHILLDTRIPGKIIVTKDPTISEEQAKG